MSDYQHNFIFDSGSSGAKNVSSDGSRFSVSLQSPLEIPRQASYAYITVEGASVWNNVHNIIQDVDDVFHIEYDDGILVVNTTITILPGLYDINQLNSAILRELNNNAIVPSDLFTLVPDTATSKVVIQFNYSGTQLDFTQSDSMNTLLGFNSRLVPLVPTTGIQYEIADNVAQFNNINYFTIGSDIVSQGIRINDSYNQTLIKIPIDPLPGSQINYEQQNPPRIPCNELIGASKKDITVWLTDNNLNLVGTNSETFSVSVNVHYELNDEGIKIDDAHTN